MIKNDCPKGSVRSSDLYSFLGVEPRASTEDIRRAWRAQVVRLHPDRAPDAVARLRAVNHAWSVLRDPERRAAYDAACARRAGLRVLLPASPQRRAALAARHRKAASSAPSWLRRALRVFYDVFWPVAPPPSPEARHGR